MANIRYEQITMSGWINYLTALDNRITAGTDAVTIDGKFTLDFPLSGTNTDRRYMRITTNGVQHQTGDWFSSMTTPFVQSIIGDNFIILRFIPSNYSGISDGGFEMIYVTDGANHYYAGVVQKIDNPFNIYDTVLYNVAEGNINYKLMKFIQFDAGAGQIAYYTATQTPILNGVNLAGMAQGLTCCSTVPLGASIALGNGKNYYAIATNAMVEITAANNE